MKFETLFSPGQYTQIMRGDLSAVGTSRISHWPNRGTQPDLKPFCCLKREGAYRQQFSISPFGEYCCNLFDEVKVKETYEYDATRQIVLRPCSQAMMVMIKGLVVNYQQVIYYNFDKNPTETFINPEIPRNLLYTGGNGLRHLLKECGPIEIP